MEIDFAEQLKVDIESTITIAVDLDDDLVKKHVVSRHPTGCVVRLLVKQGGYQQWVWLSLSANGFELTDKGGVSAELESNHLIRSLNVIPVKNGVPVEPEP